MSVKRSDGASTLDGRERAFESEKPFKQDPNIYYKMGQKYDGDGTWTHEDICVAVRRRDSAIHEG
jgi:hypothetical protein